MQYVDIVRGAVPWSHSLTNVYTCWAIALALLSSTKQKGVFNFLFLNKKKKKKRAKRVLRSLRYGPKRKVACGPRLCSVVRAMRDVICLTCCSFIEMNVEEQDALIRHAHVGENSLFSWEKGKEKGNVCSITGKREAKIGGGGAFPPLTTTTQVQVNTSQNVLFDYYSFNI